MHNHFKQALGGKVIKNKKTLELLGCDFEFLFFYLENQFSHWMNFNNHGKCEDYSYNCTWHLDHIIPISFAKNQEEVEMLSHWSNFQPLCGKKNLEKNSFIFPCTNLELGITFWENNWEYINKNI